MVWILRERDSQSSDHLLNSFITIITTTTTTTTTTITTTTTTTTTTTATTTTTTTTFITCKIGSILNSTPHGLPTIRQKVKVTSHSRLTIFIFLFELKFEEKLPVFILSILLGQGLPIFKFKVIVSGLNDLKLAFSFYEFNTL